MRRWFREPIQVYLARPDRDLLDRLAEESALSRAEFLRRGLRRMGAELMAGQHPALQFLDEVAGGDWPDDMSGDVAEQHDHYLTDPRGE